MVASDSPEGTLRRDPDDRQRLQQLRGGVWVSARAWLVPAADAGPPFFEVTSGVAEPPPGAQAIADPIALLESLQPQHKARQAIDAARLGEAARFLLDVICLIEIEDRWRWFVEPALPVIRRLLGAHSDATPFDTTLAELTGAGLVKSVIASSDIGPVEHHQVDPHLEAAVVAAMSAEQRYQMRGAIAEIWTARFLDEEASPTPTTVRAGIARAIYLKRRDQVPEAAAWVEQKVLPVARRTGEAAPVLHVLRNLGVDCGDAGLVARAETLLRLVRGG